MSNRLRFRLEYFQHFLLKYYLFIIFGTLAGSCGYLYRVQILKIYRQINHPDLIIGYSGLNSPNKLPVEIGKLISYGLTTVESNHKIITSPIVDSYQTSADNLIYTFKLKPNLYWHNGKQLSAADIKLSINNVETTPIDRLTLQVKLKETFAPLLSSLSSPLYYFQLIGLGPYKVKSLILQDSFLKTIKLESLDNKDDITYRFYNNENDLITAFKLGEVNVIKTYKLPPEFKKWPKLAIDQKIETDRRYLAVFLNTSKISSKPLRQALAYATPKTPEPGQRCLGPISPTSWAYNPSIKTYNFNPDRAQELLDKEKLAKIKLSVVDPSLLAQAEQIAKSWTKTLGVEVESKVVSAFDDSDFDAILAYGLITTDPDQYLFWHSTQKTNLTKINNSRLDKLLEEGRRQTDIGKRKEIYLDFQRYLLEESPAIFLSYPTVYTVSKENVTK